MAPNAAGEAAFGVAVSSDVSVTVGVVLAAEEDNDGDAVAHVTDCGRSVTPWVLQKVRAKSTACCCSSVLHTPSKQHAMPLMKVSLAQIHLASSRPQSPILSPVVYSARQFCYNRGRSRQYVRSSAIGKGTRRGYEPRKGGFEPTAQLGRLPRSCDCV